MTLSRTSLSLTGLAALLVGFVALRPLLPIDETRYLDVAWEMWLTGDGFHLTRNFELYAWACPVSRWRLQSPRRSSDAGSGPTMPASAIAQSTFLAVSRCS